MPTYSKTSSWLFKLRGAQTGWIGGNKPLSSARSKAAASQVSCVVVMLDFVWITDCNKRLEEPVCSVWGLLAVENGLRWAPAPHSLQPRIHLETSVPLHRLRHATLDRGRSGQLMTANSKVSTDGAFLSNQPWLRYTAKFCKRPGYISSTLLLPQRERYNQAFLI